MSAKSLVFHQSARHLPLNGVDVLAKAVKVTLGPCGRNVIVSRPGKPPLDANSGVVVSRSIDLQAPFDAMGAQLLREVATKTSGAARGSSGYDAAHGECGDMIEAGIVDPVKVAHKALQNEACIPSLLRTPDCMVVGKPAAATTTSFGGASPDLYNGGV